MYDNPEMTVIGPPMLLTKSVIKVYYNETTFVLEKGHRKFKKAYGYINDSKWNELVKLLSSD